MRRKLFVGCNQPRSLVQRSREIWKILFGVVECHYWTIPSLLWPAEERDSFPGRKQQGKTLFFLWAQCGCSFSHICTVQLHKHIRMLVGTEVVLTSEELLPLQTQATCAELGSRTAGGRQAGHVIWCCLSAKCHDCAHRMTGGCSPSASSASASLEILGLWGARSPGYAVSQCCGSSAWPGPDPWPGRKGYCAQAEVATHGALLRHGASSTELLVLQSHKSYKPTIFCSYGLTRSHLFARHPIREMMPLFLLKSEQIYCLGCPAKWALWNWLTGIKLAVHTTLLRGCAVWVVCCIRQSQGHNCTWFDN